MASEKIHLVGQNAAVAENQVFRLVGYIGRVSELHAGLFGGASTFGGEGSILATLIGALLVTTIRNGLNILGVNAFWQYVVNGIVIIAAVAIDQYRRRR